MSILENTLNRFGFISQKQFETRISEAVKQELDKVHTWLGDTADAQKWTQPNPAVFATQADFYRLSPILGTAIDLLGRKIGTTKFSVKRLRGEDELDIPNHPFEINKYGSMTYPNPLQTSIEFMQDTSSNYQLTGNSVWWLNKADRFAIPEEIWTIPYHMLQPVPDKRLYLSHYNYFPGNITEPLRFETWEIVHFKNYNPFNRYYGLSIIESLGVTLVSDQGMRRTNMTTYAERNGVMPDLLAFKDWIPDEQWKDVKKEKRDAVVSNSTMMLRGIGEGIQWIPRSISSKDAEFVATLRQNMIDIFNRIAPGLLAMLDPNATEANALAARATFAEYTLNPQLKMIAQKATAEILPAYGIKLVGEFDYMPITDQKIELEKQGAFERSHNIKEIRKEYYQDDPLGDDRDKLFISQINAQSGDIQKVTPPQPVSQPSTMPLQDTNTNDQQPQDMATQDTGQQDLSMKAAIDDLLKWRKMALRGKAEKAQGFISTVISLQMQAAIKSKLDVLSDKGMIAKVFDDAIEQMKPKPQLDPVLILRGIEAGLKALEIANG